MSKGFGAKAAGCVYAAQPGLSSSATCTCRLDPGCKLKKTLANALASFLRELDQVTLLDLLGTPQTKLMQVMLRV